MSSNERISLFLLLFVFFPNIASALIGNTEKAFGFDGSFRTFGAGIDEYDFAPFFGPADGPEAISQSIVRLVAAGRPAQFLAYEVHGVASLDAGTRTQTTAASNSSAIFYNSSQDVRYRALDATWMPLTEEHISATLFFDRFNSKVSFPFMDVTVGRQTITFGKAYFWNPLDVFSPFAANQFDRDYKPGVDALRLDVPFNNFSGMNLVGALGREIGLSGGYLSGSQAWEISWYASAVLARLFTTAKGWDYSLQGGKIYGGYQVGAGAVGEAGFFQLRGELTYFFAEDPLFLPPPLIGTLTENHFTAVAGIGHRFENTLDLQMEYLFNGNGDSDNYDLAFARVRTGESLQLSEHLVGFYATYEFTPIIVGRFGTLFSPVDSPSVQLQPGVTISLADEADLLLGAIVNFGARPNGFSPTGIGLQSEFGTSPDTYYGEFKFYF